MSSIVFCFTAGLKRPTAEQVRGQTRQRWQKEEWSPFSDNGVDSGQTHQMTAWYSKTLLASRTEDDVPLMSHDVTVSLHGKCFCCCNIIVRYVKIRFLASKKLKGLELEFEQWTHTGSRKQTTGIWWAWALRADERGRSSVQEGDDYSTSKICTAEAV